MQKEICVHYPRLSGTSATQRNTQLSAEEKSLLYVSAPGDTKCDAKRRFEPVAVDSC
jgi:hypothetical protein